MNTSSTSVMKAFSRNLVNKLLPDLDLLPAKDAEAKHQSVAIYDIHWSKYHLFSRNLLSLPHMQRVYQGS